MRRKGLAVTFFLLIALLLVLGSQKEILTATGQVYVRKPAGDLIADLGDTSFWAGFQGEIPQSVINIAPGRFVVALSGPKPAPLLVNVRAVGNDSSSVIWIRKLSLGGWVREKYSHDGPVHQTLMKLKTYAEQHNASPGNR